MPGCLFAVLYLLSSMQASAQGSASNILWFVPLLGDNPAIIAYNNGRRCALTSHKTLRSGFFWRRGVVSVSFPEALRAVCYREVS